MSDLPKSSHVTLPGTEHGMAKLVFTAPAAPPSPLEWPAPTMPEVAPFGGINATHLSGEYPKILVQTGRFTTPLAPADSVSVYWDSTGELVGVVTIQETTSGLVYVQIDGRIILQHGNGVKTYYYIQRNAVGTETASFPSTIRVKVDIPGDPDPGSGSDNPKLLAPIVVPTFIDASTVVTVTVPHWVNMDSEDRLTLHWGTATYVVPGPLVVDQDVTFVLPREVIVSGGSDPALVVRYEIRDAVGNWSKRSQSALVHVQADSTFYEAPKVIEAQNNVLDLTKLGASDVHVQVDLEQDDLLPGDIIRFTWKGLTADGQELPYGPIDETATTDSFLIFVVPNERVAGLAPQGSVALYYEVLKSTGPKRSVQRNLIVTGEAVTLQAPSVREARDGALDPEALTDGLAHLELGPYPLMALGDEVTYYWTATAPGGATWFKTEGRDVSGNDVTPVPKALVFTLTRAEIELIKGYTVSVYYTVTHFASGMKSTSRALELRIGGVITLPPPLVDHVVNGYLDPASAPTGTNIRVRTDYSGAVHGDFANVYWNALLPYSNIHAVDPARPEVVSPVGVEYITGNEGRQVTVSYTITHQGQPARQGGSTTFVIGTATSPLPAPSVLEAGAGNTLPGDATKATVRVPVGAALAVNDVVTVHWKGTVGAGTVDVSKTVTTEAGSYIDLDIPAVAIAANAGLTVRVTYTIRRYSNGRLDGPSPEYVLNVQATAPVPLFEDFSSLPIGTLIPFNNPLEAPTMTIYRQSPQFGNLRISNLQPPGHPLTSFGESAEEGLPNERVAGLFLKNSYSKVTFEFMLWNYPPFLITATDDTGELAMDNLSLMESIGTVTLIPYPGKRIKAIFVRGIFMVTNFYFTP